MEGKGEKKVFVGLLKSIQSVVHFRPALDLLPPALTGTDGSSGGFPTSPSPGPAAPAVQIRSSCTVLGHSEQPQLADAADSPGPGTLISSPGSSGRPWDVPAPVPAPREGARPRATAAAPANLTAPRQGTTGVCGFWQMGPRAESRQDQREMEGTGAGQCLFQYGCWVCPHPWLPGGLTQSRLRCPHGLQERPRKIDLFINFIHGFSQRPESRRPVLQSDLAAGSREIFILTPTA